MYSVLMRPDTLLYHTVLRALKFGHDLWPISSMATEDLFARNAFREFSGDDSGFREWIVSGEFERHT